MEFGAKDEAAKLSGWAKMGKNGKDDDWRRRGKRAVGEKGENRAASVAKNAVGKASRNKKTAKR